MRIAKKCTKKLKIWLLIKKIDEAEEKSKNEE